MCVPPSNNGCYTRPVTSLARISFACFVAAVPLLAADWPTFGHDPQRSGWAREERVLSRDNVARLTLKWKVKG